MTGLVSEGLGLGTVALQVPNLAALVTSLVHSTTPVRTISLQVTLLLAEMADGLHHSSILIGIGAVSLQVSCFTAVVASLVRHTIGFIELAIPSQVSRLSTCMTCFGCLAIHTILVSMSILELRTISLQVPSLSTLVTSLGL